MARLARNPKFPPRLAIGLISLVQRTPIYPLMTLAVVLKTPAMAIRQALSRLMDAVAQISTMPGASGRYLAPAVHLTVIAVATAIIADRDASGILASVEVPGTTRRVEAAMERAAEEAAATRFGPLRSSRKSVATNLVI